MRLRSTPIVIALLLGLSVALSGCTETMEPAVEPGVETATSALGSGPTMRKIHPYIPHQSLETYTLHASEIVEGVILSIQTFFPQDGLPYTEALLQVTDVIKGGPGDTVPVRIPGAESEDEAVVVVGAPSVQVGDRVLWFIWKPTENSPRSILGLGQGAYTIHTQTGPGGDVEVIEGLHATDGHKTLDAFKMGVEDQLNQHASARQ